MTQFRRSTERMGAAGIAQYQTARLRQAGMLPNPRKKSNPRLKKVPDHMKETPRKKAEGVYVFPKRKSYPIGDLYHARKAVLQSMWPNNLKNAPTVLQAVVATWPKYNWKAYWNKEAEEALYSHQRQGRGRNIRSYAQTLKAGRGSWEQDDPATKHRNPGKAMKRRRNSRLSDEEYELRLYIANDGALYAQRGKHIITTLAKKMANGTFNKKMAVVAFKHLADDGAKKYSVEHGTPQRGVTLRNWGRYKGFGIFTPDVRRETAKELVEYYMDQIEWEAREIKAKKKSKKKPSSRKNPTPRKRSTQVTRTRKRKNPMTKGKYMERLSNLQPDMTTARKNSLWKKYSR